MPLLPPTSAPASTGTVYPKLPDQAALATMLRELLDRDVRLQRTDDAGGPAYTALYVDRDGAPATTLSFDLGLAASAGAALALIPAGQAEAWVTGGELDGEGLDNAAEVLNVLASAFNTVDESRHVKLARVVPPTVEPDTGIAAVAATAAATARYAVTVDGYPGGVAVIQAT